MEQELIDRAKELAAYLNNEVLEEDRVKVIDLLDALASVGLKLELDADGESSSAYFLALQR